MIPADHLPPAAPCVRCKGSGIDPNAPPFRMAPGADRRCLRCNGTKLEPAPKGTFVKEALDVR